jgi:D-sedoheptulose 7-phosphate isomerase
MSTEPTAFLYPFIEAEERDAPGLLADLEASARAKVGDSYRLRAATLTRWAAELEAAGRAMAERFRAGGRLFTFGNGGSATDALGAADLFRAPRAGRPLPAMCLVDDRAVVTALANDVGFDLVFARQLEAHGRPGDMGDSRNLLQGFATAQRAGLLTLGTAGYAGGAMAADGVIEHCFVVGSDSVHRIQETQAGLTYELWRSVQRHLSGEDAV